MSYIKRRLLVWSDGQEKIVAEEDFFSLEGLKVILGEPGAGKTSLIGNLLTNGAEECSPRFLLAGVSRVRFQAGQLVVIDGVDEVMAYQNDGQGLINILAGIPPDSLSQCVLTCRAADWNAVVSEYDLQRMGHEPHVGTLVAFDDEDIKAFLDQHGDPLLANAFVETAKEVGVLELFRNPQMLAMFLEASDEEHAFPTSKMDLYEKAAKRLVTEDNDLHRGLNKNLMRAEELLRVADFICAQLILGNQQGVDINGAGDVGIASVNELASAEFGVSVVRAVLGTKLFRVATRRGVVEPCHRTMAEFLAARFISQRLNKSLSLRRLETLLYGPDFLVPAALRGIHAWVATMNVEMTRKFIRRDPEGVLEYGDTENLSGDEIMFLVTCLEEFIEGDPTLSEEGIPVGSGRGIARRELKDWLWSIICDEERVLGLRVFLLGCFNGTYLIQSMTAELTLLGLDPAVDTRLRVMALEVMLESDVVLDWIALHSKLARANDLGSLLLAHEVVKEKIGFFSGVEIVATIFRYVRPRFGKPLYALTGVDFAKKMNDAQLSDALAAITALNSVEHDWEKMIKAVGNFRSEALLEVLRRKISISPEILIQELKHQNSLLEIPIRSLSGLQEVIDLDQEVRRDLQRYVFNNSDKWPTPSASEYLERIYPSLALTEADVEDLLMWTFNSSYDKDSQRIWADVVGYTLATGVFLGNARNLAIRQADEYKELRLLMDQLVEQQKCVSLKGGETEFLDAEEWRQRHKEFEGAREGLLSGEDYRRSSQIAASYIGFPRPLELSGGNDRVRTLVGEQMLQDALRSFEAVLKKNNIPDVRQISKLRVDGPTLWWEPILIAYCVYAQEQGTLAPTLGRSALPLCYWENADGLVPSTRKIFETLRSLVLPDAIARKAFLVDFFEPFLKLDNEWVPGLHSLADDDFYADVAGQLAVEWLTQYSKKMSPYTVVFLLKTMLRFVPKSEVVEFVRRKAFDPTLQDYTQQGIYIGMLFGLAYQGNKDFFSKFISNGPESLIGFRMAVAEIDDDAELTVEQNFYIVKTFANDVREDSDLFFDDEFTFVEEFIRERLESLARSPDLEAIDMLDSLSQQNIGTTDLQEEIDGLIMHAKRMRAERARAEVTLERAREVLLSGRPSNALQLQALVMDELYICQRIVSSDPLNRHRFFWTDDQPKLENECRDLIAMMLEPRLAKYGIRIATESRMPNNNRSDILFTIGEIGISIELKCQWHRELWVAAAGQLQGYASEYRANGYGIYLVVFFGAQSSPKRRMKRSPKGKTPSSGQRLMVLLDEECRANVSSKSCFFVWDVSRPAHQRGPRNHPGSKKAV